MSRFKKFIESERKNEYKRNNEKRQSNAFKKKRRGKKVYKTKQNKEDFMKKMENNKGATIQQFNILDAIKKKPEKNKKIKKEKKKIENEFLNGETVIDQSEKEFMKQYVVNYYENQCDDEEDNEIITDTSSKKTDDIISF
tara:strand:+ start:10496 stop:10915 length:420 start_codon:yes stop_codon:yes gene_type:complete